MATSIYHDKSSFVPEILENIMKFMTLTSLSRAMLVNHHWCQVARKAHERNHLWNWEDCQSAEYQDLTVNLYLQKRLQHLRLNFVPKSFDCESRHHPQESSPCQNWPYLLANNQYPINNEDNHDQQQQDEDKGFLTELILCCDFINDNIKLEFFYPAFTTHASTLTRLEILTFGSDDLNLRFILETLTQLQSLIISPISWYIDNPPPLSKLVSLNANSLTNQTEEVDLYYNYNTDHMETLRWLKDTSVQFPNLRNLEFCCVKGLVVQLHLFTKFPNLRRLRLIDCKVSSIDAIWVRNYTPQLKYFGYSKRNFHYSQEHIVSLVRGIPTLEVMDMPIAQPTVATLSHMGYHCKVLKELDLTNAVFTNETNAALFDMLCEVPVLQRLIAPLATLNLQYAKNLETEGIVLSDRLEDLIIGLDCSTGADSNAGTPLSSEDVNDSSGDLFRYLVMYCPRLRHLRSHITPQIDLGPSGLKQLAGLGELESLDISSDRLKPIDESSLEWLEHESLNRLEERYSVNGDGYYWPRLEKITIATQELNKLEGLNEITSNLSLRFSFKLK